MAGLQAVVGVEGDLAAAAAGVLAVGGPAAHGRTFFF